MRTSSRIRSMGCWARLSSASGPLVAKTTRYLPRRMPASAVMFSTTSSTSNRVAMGVLLFSMAGLLVQGVMGDSQGLPDTFELIGRGFEIVAFDRLYQFKPGGLPGAGDEAA